MAGVQRVMAGEMLSSITQALVDLDEKDRIEAFLAKISTQNF